MKIAVKAALRTLTPSFLLPIWDRLEASPLAYRLAKGAFWSLFGALISRGFGIAAYIFVARMLGKQGFGEFGIIQNTAGMFGTLAGFGLGLTATKHVAEFRKADPERVRRILTLCSVVAWTTGIIAALTLLGIAPWLATRTLAASQLTPELRIAALLVLIGAVNGAQTGALAGFEAFKRIAQLSFFTGLFHVPCLISGSHFFALAGAVGGLAAAQVIGCGLNYWGLRREARLAGIPHPQGNWRLELPMLWNFSLPALLASLLTVPILWFCQALLARQSGGYEALAEYTVGAQWRQLVHYVPMLLASAYLPIAASLKDTSPACRRRFMLQNAAFATIVTAGIALAVYLAAPWILAAYGAGFTGAKFVLGLLLITGTVDSANSILMKTLMATGWAWLRLWSNAVWGFLLIACALLWVPQHGALGLAAALCIAQIIHLGVQMLLSLYVTRREL